MHSRQVFALALRHNHYLLLQSSLAPIHVAVHVTLVGLLQDLDDFINPSYQEISDLRFLSRKCHLLHRQKKSFKAWMHQHLAFISMAPVKFHAEDNLVVSLLVFT